MRIPHLSKFAINYTIEKRKTHREQSQCVKNQIRNNYVRKRKLIFVVFSVFVVQSHEKLTFIASANIETVAEI